MTRKGYPKLAAWMAKHPETAIFRKFGDLQLRSLLYMQARLISLEQDLDILAERDSNLDYDCDYQALADSSEDGEGEDGLQKQKLLEICNALKEYSL